MKLPLWRRKQNAELDEEIRAHLEAAVRERIARGESRAQAEAAARREFGNVALVKDVTRDAWGWTSLDQFAQDVRYGLRQLRRNPGFTMVAVLTLALGIGANTAIFSTVNAVMFRPLPVQSPSEIVSFRNAADTGMFDAFSYPNYRDVRDRNHVFSDLIAYTFAPVAMSYEGGNERVWCYMVSGNYFPGLGLRAHLGRLITPDDDQLPGAHPVAVLGYDSWQKRFGGRPDVVGKEFVVNGRSYAIIGVGPKGFTGTKVGAAPEIWFPVAMQAAIEPGINVLEARGDSGFFVLGRMKPGVSHAQVQANLDSLAQSLVLEFPEENKGMRLTLVKSGLAGFAPFRGAMIGLAALLLAVAALVLLLACANLSNMLLARATERREETAIRLAMGASRGRLVRQLLTESTLLALGGGLLGMLPALWPLRFSLQMRPPADFPISLEVHWDYRVLAFGFFITLVTGVLFGLLPALQATKADVAPALKSGQLPGRRRGWVWGSLIAAQVALSLMLLTGAGLMVRALRQAGTLDLGFDPHNAIELGFDLRMQGYDAARGREIQKQALERIRAVPGVRAAGITDLVPVDLHFSSALIFVEGAPEERTASTPRALGARISPGYFEAMGTRLLAGRDFTDGDGFNAEPVAIVNQAFARRFWPGEDAIGKRFSISNPRAPKLKVVGIVQDGKYNSLSSDPRPCAFRALWQSYTGSTGLVVRSNLDPASMIPTLRREIARLDPHMPVNAAPLADRLSLALLPARVTTTILGSFALLGLTLAAIGIYGVISYAVSRRTRELGIRMALGAHKSDVLRLVIRQGMRPAILGALIGLPATYALTRLMKTFLFGFSATDPLTYSATAALLMVVAILACYLPARRATRVDPLTALRHE